MNITNPRIEEYCKGVSTLPSELAQELESITLEKHPLGHMVTGSLVSSIIGFMIKTQGVKSILEIGTFTGFSSLAMAEVLPADGHIDTIDKNKKINSIATEYWNKSEHGHKISAHFGEAMKVLPTLERKYDMVFIDADKRNYLNYLKSSISLLNEKGFIIIDNVLWDGRVAESAQEGDARFDKSTAFIQELNNYLRDNSELYATLLPVRDGLFLVTKM